ncbi:UDP-glucosyltransferase 2 [Manduca sexta]|uniref:UDP-glucuronosyltransferase n=1 Tax=Manduca sexta TaxID=7130 RepID=A0A921ZN49_MANSE|nr:UDP-glucosyltransferase 2 [Manduca sexta]KAG6460675.1 UDP-glycosyltransferase [Manduca sexta]
MRLWLWAACLLQGLWCLSAYHVLVVFPVPSRSHNALGKGVVDALLQAGHEVSWATPYPPKEKVKNLNIIDVSITTPIIDALETSMEMMVKMAMNFTQLKTYTRTISKTAITAPALRDAVIKGQFDAVVTEYFFSETDAGYAAVLKVPWIQVNGVMMNPVLEDQMDEVRSISTVPQLFNSAVMPMPFLNRLLNSFMYLTMAADKWMDWSEISSMYKEMFAPLASARGTSLPSFDEAYYNVSVLLVNSHGSYAPALSLPPNVVEVGGYHLKDSVPPLPKDLQELLDGSPQGVVYFSMGSVLKSAKFPDVTKRELLQVLGELKQTVLWKFEEQLENMPKNVHIRSWMPQDSILAHPNVKVFITHGGLLSTLEALNSGVPLLAVPIFGDQPANAERIALAGFGRHIKFRPEMAQDLKVELREMLSNDSYLKKAKSLSSLFHNRVVPPKKLISRYIELAIETNGAYHLRSSSRLYPWYQRWMLDQLALVLLVLLLAFLALRFAFRAVSNKIWGNKSIKVNKVKKN